MGIRTPYGRGSVLMEFVIVLPLYFALLGTAFLYGDLSLHAVNMAASGDRTLAVSHGMSPHGDGAPGWKKDDGLGHVKKAVSLSDEYEEVTDGKYTDVASSTPIAANASDFSDETHGVVADSGFKGSWSWLVGSVLRDDYALSPVSRSFIRAWKVFADVAEMNDPDWAKDREYADGSTLKQLFPHKAGETHSVGRVEGKDGNVRAYAYYTLMRNDAGRRSYRGWTSAYDVGGLLSDNGTVWDTCVCQEPYFFDKKSFEDLAGDDDRGGKKADCSGRSTYRRYEGFKKWSD